MDFDPRDDSRDEERLDTRDGKAGSYDDLDRDDDLRLLHTRSSDRDHNDSRTLGRGPGDSRQSNAGEHSRDPRDDARWPDRDREPPDRTFDPREAFSRDLDLPRGLEDELEAQLKTADEPPPLLHPRMADLYKSKVEELAAALQREDTRLEASEMLRGARWTPGGPWI